MNIIYRIIASLGVFLSSISVFAANSKVGIGTENYPDGYILQSDGVTVVGVLGIIQSFLLKVLLPIIVVGGALYIAYELFTAEGDETKMKRAWKSVAFTAVGLVSIAVSYGFVSILSRISL